MRLLHLVVVGVKARLLASRRRSPVCPGSPRDRRKQMLKRPMGLYGHSGHVVTCPPVDGINPVPKGGNAGLLTTRSLCSSSRPGQTGGGFFCPPRCDSLDLTSSCSIFHRERSVKATEAKFLDYLKNSPQFVIPIYQRTYSWTERECRQLLDDIVRTGSNDAIPAHFIGSIVYIEKGSQKRSLFVLRQTTNSSSRGSLPARAIWRLPARDWPSWWLSTSRLIAIKTTPS